MTDNLSGRLNPMVAAQPVSFAQSAAKPLDYNPQTRSGRYMKAVGENSLNAVAPGGPLRRTASVILPALGSEGAGDIARNAGGNPFAVETARLGGGLAGSVVSGLRQNPFASDPAAEMMRRTRMNPDDMQRRATEYRAANIAPTLADVTDDSGRGLIRAAANRPTPGREVANIFAEGRSLDLPSRIGAQARRVVSQDPRTPDQIRGAMATQRRTNADQAFGAVRGDPVELDARTLATFRVPEVADAVADAARRERDPEARTALAMLAQWAKSGTAPAQAPPLTVGMLDRVSRVLLGKANASADQDLAATLRNFGEGLRNPARAASSGYRSALEGYAADSRLGDAVGLGESLMGRNTDEFAAQAGQLSDQERALALAGARRAIERRAGESISGAPAVARTLADAPEQQARNAALMGPDRARALQDAMRLEARAVSNASQIAPGRGSSTFLNAADAERVGGAFQAGSNIFRGRWGALAGQVADYFRTRGLNDAQAEALVSMATDPRQTDRAVELARQVGGEEAVARLADIQRAALTASVHTSFATHR